MIFSAESIVEDFAPFGDLGTEPPFASVQENMIALRLIRDGSALDLNFLENGSVIENAANGNRSFPSRRALLASPRFANLGKWADSQKLLLKSTAEQDSLPISGISSDDVIISGLAAIDELISAKKNVKYRNVVTLIDGPAGIGKTSIIRQLAFNRAIEYRKYQNSLILLVESRGRVLQNLTDLMAFSIQTLRVPVTYDQVPTLVRCGLLTLAIDGFDELVPTILSLPHVTLTEPWEIENWILSKEKPIEIDGIAFNRGLAREFPSFNLFQRLIRYKPFWLKEDGGRAAHRILYDENWDVLKSIMLKHDLLIERHDVPSSGRPAPFYHVKNRQALMERDWVDAGITPFLIELLRASMEMKNE